MTTSIIRLQCRCGAVHAIATGVTPSACNHCICYCHDCQAFAHFLGCASDVLDAHGGTDIFQISPASLRFTAGREHLACLRLTPKGLLRWHTRCCNTPVANTLPSPGMPFVGAIRAFASEPAETALGPIRGYAFRESAKGDRASVPTGGLPAPLMVMRVVGKMLSWRLQGHHRLSPFFDAQTGAPLVEARVLTAAERDELRRLVIAV
jgi:hypothetical protein